VGENGPTWSLIDRLLPLMEQSGTAIYVSGRDPIAQLITAVPPTSPVDFVGVGNGALGNASQAEAPPNLLLCPYNSLAWAYGGSAGFATIEVTQSLLTVTWFDQNGSALYNFSKGNPRAGLGYAPVGVGSYAPVLLGMAGLFAAVASLLCCVAASSYLRSAAAKLRQRGAERDRGGGERIPLLPSKAGRVVTRGGL